MSDILLTDREKVAEWLANHFGLGWDSIDESEKEDLRKDADQIIALIVDEDAELPDNPHILIASRGAYTHAQQDMLAAGWRKVRGE